jgi:ATP-dependent Lhr-like helicase
VQTDIIPGGLIEHLDPRIAEVLFKRNIVRLHTVQESVFRDIYEGKNVLICAPTGIGKTEAAMLPILQRMIEERGRRCLYITPLRSLNRDMLLRLRELASAVGLEVSVRHGDTLPTERSRQSRHMPDVIITTPETVQLLLQGKRLREGLSGVRFVVVDEIHELLSGERGAQLSVALERLERISPSFQRIGLSATIGSPEEAASLLCGNRDVVISNIPVEKGREIQVLCPLPDKDTGTIAAELQIDEGFASTLQLGKRLIEENRSTLFFVNTRDLAEAIASRYHLWLPEFPVGVHHGSLSRELRVQTEEFFKSGRLKCLICTSSLELGIDIGSVDMTIQFNSPRQVTRLLQRVGRAGHRADEVSRGRILAYDEDEILEAAVIARRAMKENMERQRVRENPLSVLANQIIAMASEGAYDRQSMYETVRRSYPFRNLERWRFNEVFDFLVSNSLIREEGEVRRTMKGLHYFYENISMIRDEKTYSVRDISTRRIIGTLDESFIFSLEEEAVFITHGRSWKIVEIREKEVLVEPVAVLGALPSWVGEEIPVPFEVAQEVGELRRNRQLHLYPLDEEGKQKILSYLQSVPEQYLPTDRRIVIESDRRKIVVHACFGTKVNETLSRMIAAVISARSGEGVGIDIDPYRIMIDLPSNARKEWVGEALKSVAPEVLPEFMRKIVSNVSYAKYQFLYVGKKFGVIRKDADYREMNLSRLMASYEGTPVMEETIEKTIWESMDLESTAEVLSRIRSGEIEIVYAPLSRLGEKGLQETREMYRPARADKGIIDALRKRLMHEEFKMLCLHCRATRHLTAATAERKILCWKCGGEMLAALSKFDMETYRKNVKDLRWRNKLTKNADLVRTYGPKALLVLAGRGIGPDAAARILSTTTDEEKLLKKILEQEIQFARTKRFWD